MTDDQDISDRLEELETTLAEYRQAAERRGDHVNAANYKDLQITVANLREDIDDRDGVDEDGVVPIVRQSDDVLDELGTDREGSPSADSERIDRWANAFGEVIDHTDKRVEARLEPGEVVQVSVDGEEVAVEDFELTIENDLDSDRADLECTLPESGFGGQSFEESVSFEFDSDDTDADDDDCAGVDYQRIAELLADLDATIVAEYHSAGVPEALAAVRDLYQQHGPFEIDWHEGADTQPPQWYGESDD